MTRISVLQVGKGPPDSGGISAMISTLTRRLATDHPVEMLNLTRAESYTAGVLSAGNLARTLQDVRSVYTVARGFDVVHVHSAFVPTVTIIRAALLLVAARLGGAKTILHVHGGGLPEWASSVFRRVIANAAARFANTVIAVSDGIAGTLSHPRLITIYNGVDTEEFSPGTEGPNPVPVVTYVGLLTRRKGVVDLMEAAEALRGRDVDFELVLIGGRPDEGEEEEAIVRSAASGHEMFVGNVEHREIADRLRQADIFCLPSWFEAMPLSILEAMATGLPVVATRVGQVPDVVDEGIGRLVDHQSPEQLADALEELIRDPGLRHELGAAARRRALETHSLEATIERIRSVIDELGAQSRTTSA